MKFQLIYKVNWVCVHCTVSVFHVNRTLYMVTHKECDYKDDLTLCKYDGSIIKQRNMHVRKQTV